MVRFFCKCLRSKLAFNTWSLVPLFPFIGALFVDNTFMLSRINACDNFYYIFIASCSVFFFYKSFVLPYIGALFVNNALLLCGINGQYN